MGRKKISKEIRDLIFLMVAENPTWGAPRIHGELLMLGFEVSERTGFPVDATSIERFRARQALAQFPAQP
jgi:hypothetical protein